MLCCFCARLRLRISPDNRWNFHGRFGRGNFFRQGTRAAVFGNERGNLEAWVYPLKILRDFHLRFHIDGATIPAETLARTLMVHPESTTIVYTGYTFSVRETLFVPVHEAGVVIAFEVDTAEPLEIHAVFKR